MAAPATCPVALRARIRRCRFAHPLPIHWKAHGREETVATRKRRCIGLDVHRDFAQVAIWQAGVVSQAGTFATTPEGVREFAAGLGPADEVALEATGNTWAIAALLASRAGRVVVSNPAKTRAIAEAKVKTDKVDAAILAQLLAADFLPPEHALAWSVLPGGDACWHAYRLSIVRGFAAWLATIDRDAQVPPAGLIPSRHHRATPYLYADAEISALIAAAVSLRFPLRTSTYQTLIGLLAVTGMRVGEAISLDRDDADLDTAVLTIREGKHGKSIRAGWLIVSKHASISPSTTHS